MSTLTKPFTFTGGEFAVASEVNSNFDGVFGWINGGDAIWADASRAFTSVPVGPSVDPTTPNQFTRKLYVDTVTAAVLATIKLDAYFPTAYGSGNQNKIEADSVDVTAGTGGNFTILFATGFTASCASVVACAGTSSDHANWHVQVDARSNSGFNGRICQTEADAGVTPGGVYKVNYIAAGV